MIGPCLALPFVAQRQVGRGFDPLSIWTESRTGVHLVPTPTTTGVSVGSAITTITDQSPADRTVTQATAARRPVLRQNGSGGYYMEFDGTDDWLVAADLTLGANVSLYFALTNANQTSGGSIHRPFLASDTEDSYATSGTTYGLGLSRDGSDAVRGFLGHGAGIDAMVYNVATGGENFVIRVTNDATAGDLTVNGTSRDTTTFSRTSGFGTGYAIGAHAGLIAAVGSLQGRAYAGDIYGVILVNDILTDAEDSNLRNYLSSLFTGGS